MLSIESKPATKTCPLHEICNSVLELMQLMCHKLMQTKELMLKMLTHLPKVPFALV